MTGLGVAEKWDVAARWIRKFEWLVGRVSGCPGLAKTLKMKLIRNTIPSLHIPML